VRSTGGLRVLQIFRRDVFKAVQDAFLYGFGVFLDAPEGFLVALKSFLVSENAR
jgi:hypothetical protein